ncbi:MULTISPECIES: PAS domain-containing protein [Halorussus]|uniref:PAS domain-containing protein n=1 Tax=Halorussus TaxID=1070314 RepID=UPI0020A0B97F|nr:PAS domain-containing protein [Halorussus vallis]USZ75314.1 PAS domain-containing protein [Halorussus vallis]
MEPSREANAELRTRVRQQEVVAELGQRALETGELDRLMHDAAVAVSRTLETDYAAVLELSPAGDEAVLREGVGWREGTVGTATRFADDSHVARARGRTDPVIVDDFRTHEEFSAFGFLDGHDVTGGIAARIGSSDDPWGVLGVYATDRRSFTENDATFVRSVANVLASAIENERTQSELEEIYGRISDAFFALDEEWRFTYLNERAHELINPEGRTLVGRNVWEEFPEAIGRKFKSKYEHAMYEQETVAFEEYYPEPLDAWFEVRAYPSESGLSVYFRDVTDRRKREQRLERKERQFEAVFEDPNILVGLLDPSGKVLDINQTAMEYIDADLGAVTGEPFWETPWWGEGDEGADVREWVERAAAGEYVDFETDLTRPDGEVYTINGVFRPVTNDEGEVVSVLVSDRDITERREYERQLEQSEQRYRTLAESFPNGIVTLFDEDLRYTLAAGRAFETLPVSRDDLEDRTPREAWGEEVADALEPALRDALDGEETAVEVTYVDREWIIYVVPITDEDGDVFGGMTMAQDITERKEYRRRLEETVEKLEESNERLESFASMLAHELRNPVTIGQIYGRQLPDESDSEAVEYVTEAFDRIEDMIDVLLVLARGRKALGERTPVDLAAAAREAWEDLDTDDATLDVTVDGKIQADETYIRHLFKNLFENAVKHGGPGVGVTVGDLPDDSAGEDSTDESVGVSAESSEDEARQGARRTAGGFYVEDDGDGISADYLESVFEVGYTTAAGEGGTGLGLAFVRELAETYEWDCRVTEGEAGGARFEFTGIRNAE